MITYKYEGENNTFERIDFLLDEISQVTNICQGYEDVIVTVDGDDRSIEVSINRYEGYGNNLDEAIKDLVSDYENTHIEDYIKLYEEDLIENEVNEKLNNEKEEIC